MPVILQGSLRHIPPREMLLFIASTVESATLRADGKATLCVRRGKAVWGESAEGNDVVAAAAAIFSAEALTVTNEVSLPAEAQIVAVDMRQLVEEAEQRAAGLANHVKFRVVDDAVQDNVNLTGDEFRLVIKIGSGKSVGELLGSGTLSRAALSAALKNLEAHGLIVRVEEKRAVSLSDADATRIAVIPRPENVEPPPVPRRTRAKRVTASLTADPPSGSVYMLLEDEYTVGRDASNKIALNHSSVSSNHAVVSRTPGGAWSIVDLGSSNGTFVNGERITERRVLSDNDIVRLGKVVLTFNIAGELTAGETTERTAL